MRAFKYFRVGLKQEDWDYAYLQELMKFKLEQMYDSFNYNTVDGNINVSAEIAVALEHLNRWMDSEHLRSQIHESLNLKYGIQRELKEVDVRGSKYFRPVMKSTNGMSIESYKAELRVAAEQEAEAVLNARNEFFRILRTRMEYWWD